MSRASVALDIALKRIDVETFCRDNGVVYRLSTGVSGQQINVRKCPRCGGAAWKVFLNAASGLGCCFHGSCVGAPGFNLFTFARHELGLSSKETTEYFKGVGRRRKWGVDANCSDKRRTVASSSLKLPESVPITSNNEAEYIEGRGFDSRLAEYFGWRLCIKGGFRFSREDGSFAFQPYDQRVIIPVYDIQGALATFQGRDITGKALPKYLFPPGLPGTGRYLYNAHRATGVPNVIINEGVFDVAATTQAFQDADDVAVVGSFGKSLSRRPDMESREQDQFAQLKRLQESGAERFVIMWDGEAAAIASACNTAIGLVSAGLRVFIAILPKGKDPNEVSAEQVREAYLSALEATKSNIIRILLTIDRR